MQEGPATAIRTPDHGRRLELEGKPPRATDVLEAHRAMKLDAKFRPGCAEPPARTIKGAAAVYLVARHDHLPSKNPGRGQAGDPRW